MNVDTSKVAVQRVAHVIKNHVSPPEEYRLAAAEQMLELVKERDALKEANEKLDWELNS